MAAVFLLVVYDISNDRRRTRLHDVLLNYGTPVQYSVFECLLPPRKVDSLHKAVRKVIRPQKDRVRFYSLCAECAGRTVITSGVEVLRPSTDALVVGGEEGQK